MKLSTPRTSARAGARPVVRVQKTSRRLRLRGADKSFNIGKRWDLYLRVDPFYQATLSEIASASLHEIEPEIALFKQAMLGT